MEIKLMGKEIYAGQRFTARYQTRGYYDLCAVESGFRLEYKSFAVPLDKSFEDVFFSEWLDDPVAYGAFENGRLLGYVEGFLETWNNRYRISNICIFDQADRRRGIGALLMDTILKEAHAAKARMVVLETQTCNENAVAFYRRNGFEIIGFDLYAYSNTDPENHEVRIEMGKKLEYGTICFREDMNIVRAHNIPLRYFTYASAEKCALQLAEADCQYEEHYGKHK